MRIEVTHTYIPIVIFFNNDIPLVSIILVTGIHLV